MIVFFENVLFTHHSINVIIKIINLRTFSILQYSSDVIERKFYILFEILFTFYKQILLNIYEWIRNIIEITLILIKVDKKISG